MDLLVLKQSYFESKTDTEVAFYMPPKRICTDEFFKTHSDKKKTLKADMVLIGGNHVTE